MDLVIKQNVNQQENGNSALLDLLYNLTKPDPITGQAVVNNAILVGRISVPSAYEDAVNFLNDKFSSEQDNGSDFQVTVLNNNYYIRFADQEVVKVLLENGIGDGTGVTVQDAATANLGLIFKNNTTIESFNELQYFSKTLAEGAFYGCSSLKSVTLSDSPTVLNRSIFGSTALISINIPVGYTTVRQNCFSRCSMLTQVSIPSTLTSSEDYAFANCNALDRVDITDLDAWCEIMFGNTSSNPLYYAKHLYLNNTLVTTLDLTNITVINKYVFINLESLTSITNFSGLISIGSSAFIGCTNLVIPNLALPTLASLGGSAFSGTKVQTISDLGSITSIPSSCFKDCKQLSSVSLSNLITSIGNSAFQGCLMLQSITIPNTVTSIGTYAFDGSGLLSVTIPNSITVIPDHAFSQSSLTSVTLPNTITRIGDHTFWKSYSLTTINFEEGLLTIDGFSLEYCKLGQVTLPNSLTTIGNTAFYQAKITSLVIGTGIETIGESAFENNPNCSSITIKATNPPTLGSKTFDNTGNCPIYVPSGSVSAYQSASGWSTYASRIQAIQE